VITELIARVEDAAKSSGQATYDAFVVAAQPIMLWVDYFGRSNSQDTPGLGLLDGVRSILAEVAACLVMGLSRPALTLMRSEIDLMLAWLYYSEHPREWRYVNATADGYKLKYKLLRTFEVIDPAFKRRFSVLKSVRSRSEEDPYRLLSAHIHLQNEAVLPSLQCLADVVDEATLPQVLELQSETSEYISDVCFSLYASEWVAISVDLTGPLKSRFKSPAQFQEFMRET
jgi:hypothetical protein